MSYLSSEYGNLRGDPVTIVECVEMLPRILLKVLFIKRTLFIISYEGLEKMRKKYKVHRDIGVNERHYLKSPVKV